MSIVLKPGREKSVKNRHHWIFSGAIKSLSSEEAGIFLPVVSSSGEHLGFGSVSPKGSIRVRMLSFSKEPPDSAFCRLLQSALLLRKNQFDERVTNAFRLVNGEGDGLPGLIVDRYNDVAVLQISSSGMERMRPLLYEELKRFGIENLYERSLSDARVQEGLTLKKEVLFGKEIKETEIIENGLRFLVDIHEGQKTGFFLDQRCMRERVEALSKNRRVLNCFSYSGGFTLYALRGKCNQVVSVDISSGAISLVTRNVQLNGFSLEKSEVCTQDVFEFLRNDPLQFDLVILDPPAFAKKRSHIQQAAKGYKEINRLAMEKMPAGSLLLTCSCSHFIDETLFRQILFSAAKDAGREVKIVGSHQTAIDHPINLFHPESEYLKSSLLYIS